MGIIIKNIIKLQMDSKQLALVAAITLAVTGAMMATQNQTDSFE